jgi:acyl carrier protein
VTSVQAVITGYIAQDLLHLESGRAPTLDQNLLAERVLDSLGLQQLVTFIEAEYALDIGDDDLLPENFESIRTIARLVEQLRRR